MTCEELKCCMSSTLNTKWKTKVASPVPNNKNVNWWENHFGPVPNELVVLYASENIKRYDLVKCPINIIYTAWIQCINNTNTT